MLLVQPLISYEFPAINLTPKAQIHTAIQDGKYVAKKNPLANQRLAPQ